MKEHAPQISPIASPTTIPHTVRVSNRAQRAILRMLPAKGLEVVLPRHADPACVPGLLEKFRPWIERVAFDMYPVELPPVPPFTLALYGGTEQVHVTAQHSNAYDTQQRLSGLSAPEYAQCERTNVIFLDENIVQCQHTTPCAQEYQIKKVRFLSLPEKVYSSEPPAPLSALGIAWLRRWVRREAQTYLNISLSTLAEQYELRYNKMSIRFQRTRWGSCSSKKNISLNGFLIFLPKTLIQYILLHELCHLKEMNHSTAYWKTVLDIDPQAMNRDKLMRAAWKYVPQWLV